MAKLASSIFSDSASYSSGLPQLRLIQISEPLYSRTNGTAALERQPARR